VALGIGTIISKVTDVALKLIPDKDLREKIRGQLAAQRVDAESDLAKLEIESERDMYVAYQETVQADLHQSDLYTKRTRPKIARQSWYITATYALSEMIIPVLPSQWNLGVPEIHWEIFLVLASPALTYMGVRGFEKWKNGKNH